MPSAIPGLCLPLDLPTFGLARTLNIIMSNVGMGAKNNLNDKHFIKVNDKYLFVYHH